MIGAIIGDIVGSRFEIFNHKSKDFTLFDKFECSFTDDSVMTLAVAKSLLDCKDNFENLKEITIKNMVKIGRKYPSCGYGETFYKWILTDKHEPYNSFGNGAAMRVSACGIVAKSIEEAKDLSRKVTEISHNHEEGLKGAESVAVAIFLAKTGWSKEKIREYIDSNYYKIGFTLDEIREKYHFDVTCQGSVPQAFEAFFESNSFEDAIRNAISIGGDSDTIAAITGGIAGIFYGVPREIRDEAIEFLEEDLKEILYEFENKYKNIKSLKD